MSAMSVRARCAVLLVLGACASVAASQSFELSTEYVAMPALPNVSVNQPQTVSLTASFGSCSKTALGSLDSLRADSHVSSADLYVIVRDIQLHSDATFSGIQNLTLQLITPDETVTACDRALSAAEQQASTITCPFEHRVRAEQLCASLSGSSSVAQMTVELKVLTGDVSLTKIGASIAVETELDVGVHL